MNDFLTFYTILVWWVVICLDRERSIPRRRRSGKYSRSHVNAGAFSIDDTVGQTWNMRARVSGLRTTYRTVTWRRRSPSGPYNDVGQTLKRKRSLMRSVIWIFKNFNFFKQFELHNFFITFLSQTFLVFHPKNDSISTSLLIPVIFS